MVSNQGKWPRHESVISIFLFAVLFLIGLVIISAQFDFRKNAVPAVAGPEDIHELISGISPAGFKAISEIEEYNADNLYEKIDGKAPYYTETGFVKLFTRWLVSESDENLMFEFYVFDMGLFANAFCVYSTQKRPDAQVLPAFNPDFGYRTENAVFFVHGKYYVELVGSAVSGELLAAQKDFAGKFRDGLPDEKTGMPEFSIFVGENLVAGSIKLYLSAGLGFDGFDNTLTAVYKIDDKETTVFVSRRVSQQQAKELVEKYYEFLIDVGGKNKELDLPIEGAKAVDFYGPTEIVFHKGNFVAGIHEAEDEAAAVKAAVLLNDILEKANHDEQGQ